MRTVREIIEDLAARHDDRMKNDPRYAMSFRYMQQATKPVEPSSPRHYDRDGYCDNPARGY